MERVAGALMALVLVGAAVPATAGAAGLRARGSVQQVQVTGAPAGAKLVLLNGKGHRVKSAKAGALGGAIFRHVKAGRGYRVRQGAARTKAVHVLTTRSAPPSTKLYGQKIPSDGYGYLRTRDGTKLAVDVHLPSGASGPYPTLIEYAGYGYANPAGGESSIAAIANLLGFAVVDVNMRGTGCSGGAFDFFEPLQGLDGYDVIETVARQPWVMHHRVGMMGISYGGISQLFVAATRPPSLAAIAPLSVIDNTQTTLYPGGVLNTGFAVEWATERVHDAKPASSTGGQGWALKRIDEGDQTCKDDQVLHTAAVDLIAKIHRNRFYVPKVADPLAPVTFVHKIKVPVFMACQWTDEQTGGHCPTLPAQFTGTKRKWFTFTNGTHIDSLDPYTFNRWFDFLSLYVRKEVPKLPPSTALAAPGIYQLAMGVPGVTLPSDPIQSEPNYHSALAAFRKYPPIRILFDSGAGGVMPGMPYPAFEQSFSRLPIPGTKARSWYLSAAGGLTSAKPKKAGTASFDWKASARPPTDFTGNTAEGNLWTASPTYKWTQNPAGTAVSYLTPPLTKTTTVIGAGALQAWVKSTVPNTDLQVTISEVRPDGKETFVQSGWLRGNGRKLDKAKSTPLQPVLSLRRKDAATLPKGRFTKVVVPFYYQGHVYRAGSKLRITISAPGGDQPIWAFADTKPKRGAKVTVASAPKRPSRLVLPVVAGVHVSTGLPPCPGLRGEPCRTYEPLTNRTP